MHQLSETRRHRVLRACLPTLTIAAIVTGCSAPGQDELEAAGRFDEEAARSTDRQAPPARKQNPTERLNELVEQSRADLAARLGVDADTISVEEARHVIWPDGSAGCPMPDYDYMQMLTQGVLIRLKAEGRVFQYHSGVAGPAVYCAKPSAISPPSKFEEK